MKKLLLPLLLAARLLAQNAGAGTIIETNILLDEKTGPGGDDEPQVDSYDILFYQITRDANGVKTFNFIVYHCVAGGTQYQIGLLFPGALSTIGSSGGICQSVSSSVALSYAPVQELIGDFYNDDSDAPHKLKYGPYARPAGPSLTVAQPVTPPDPYMVALDGFGSTLIKFDLATSATIAQVTVPGGAGGPLAIRPNSTGPQNEVWVATGGSGITVGDLGTQQTASIATSFPAPATPVAIAFSNSGLTAYEAFRFASPDSAGNIGAIAIFDATKRALTSTFLMKFAPTAFLLSPDGLTAYLLDSGGRISYYDVLSGTADLTLSTYTSGVNNGYGGAEVFIHPDGTRLFWHVGPFIESFDIATHKVTAQYSSGLPTTSAASILMGADGQTISISNGAGAFVVIETHSGNVIVTGQDTGAAQVFPGPLR